MWQGGTECRLARTRRLSTGQKATAVLLLLLLESDAPLIIEPAEDDLDNRFITEGIVPKMREEKQRRHSSFLPTMPISRCLEDAELIIGLRASGEAGQGYAEIPVVHMGSIDATPVRELVEEISKAARRLLRCADSSMDSEVTKC